MLDRFQILSFSVAVLALITRLGMSETISKGEMLAEYEPEAKKLEDFYRRAQITGISTKSDWGGLGGTEVTKHVFKGNGKSLRVDEILIETPRYPPPPWVQWITVASPSGSFQASRASGQPTFVLRDHGGDSARMDTVIRWKYKISSAPYQFRDYTILEFLKLPELNINNCERLVRNGESLVKVSYQYPGTVPGSFLFSVDKHWALIENTNGTDFQKDRLVVEYELENGMPVMRRIESWREVKDGRKSMHEVIDITEFLSRAASEKEFTVASVGLPDPGPRRGRRWMLLLTIVGIICLLIARIVRSRQNAAAK
jgi:hypothetical protein